MQGVVGIHLAYKGLGTDLASSRGFQGMLMYVRGPEARDTGFPSPRSPGRINQPSAPLGNLALCVLQISATTQQVPDVRLVAYNPVMRMEGSRRD